MEQKTRKQQIINTAAILFKEKGYSAVTMRDIAKTMEIKASSLYNHISSKQQILSDIIIALAEAFTRDMKIILESEATSIQKLNKIIELHVSISTDNPYEMACLNSDWMHLEEKQDYYLKLRDDYENDFRNILIIGIKNEELVNANAEVMLFSILSTLRSLYVWIPKKEDLLHEGLAENLSNVLLKGISKVLTINKNI